MDGAVKPKVSHYRLVRGGEFGRSFHLPNGDSKTTTQKRWGRLSSAVKFMARPKHRRSDSEAQGNGGLSRGKSLWDRAFRRAVNDTSGVAKDNVSGSDAKGTSHEKAKHAFLQRVLSFGNPAAAYNSRTQGWGSVINSLNKYKRVEGNTVTYQIPQSRHDEVGDRRASAASAVPQHKHVTKYMQEVQPGTRRRRKSSVTSIDQDGIRELMKEVAHGEDLPVHKKDNKTNPSGPKSIFYEDLDEDQRDRLQRMFPSRKGLAPGGPPDLGEETEAQEDDFAQLVDVDEEKEGQKIQWYYVNPSSPTKRMWDAVVYAIVLLTAILVPLEFFDREPVSMANAGYAAYSIVAEVLFAIDMVVTCVTGVPGRWGDTVYDVRTSTKGYLRGFMIPDVLAIIPLRFLLSGTQARLFGLLKLLRLARIWKLNSSLEKFPGANLWRLLALLGAFVLLAHILGSIWFLLAYVRVNEDGSTFGRQVWIAGFVENVRTEDFSSLYTLCIYFALTSLTTVGYGDITAVNNLERGFVCALLLLAALSSALVFGNVAVLIQEFDRSQSRYQSRISAVTEFFKLHKLHPTLEAKTLKYVDAIWGTTRGIDHNAVLAELPNYIRDEIMLSLHQPLVASVKVFRSFSRAFMKTLVRFLKPQAALPGDFIIMEGDKATAMYFIYKGFVQVVKRLDEELITVELGPGMFFGESALLNQHAQQRRDASVFASTMCHLFVLESHDFEDVMADFPEYRDVLQDMEARRMEVAKLRHKMTRSSVLGKLPTASETFSSKAAKSSHSLKPTGSAKDPPMNSQQLLSDVRDRVLEAKKDARLGRLSMTKDETDLSHMPGWVQDQNQGFTVAVKQHNKAIGSSVAQIKLLSSQTAAQTRRSDSPRPFDRKLSTASVGPAREFRDSMEDPRASPVAPYDTEAEETIMTYATGSVTEATQQVTMKQVPFHSLGASHASTPTQPHGSPSSDGSSRNPSPVPFQPDNAMDQETKSPGKHLNYEKEEEEEGGGQAFPTAMPSDSSGTKPRRSLALASGDALSKSDGNIRIVRKVSPARRGSMPARRVRFGSQVDTNEPPAPGFGPGPGPSPLRNERGGRRGSMYQKVMEVLGISPCSFNLC